MTKEEYKRRYIEYWASRAVPEIEGDDIEKTRAELRKAGEADFEGVEFEELKDGFEEDPEGAAAESLSYYD